MTTEFLNSQFSSLDDLANIDSIVSALEEERTQLKAIASSSTHHSDESRHLLVLVSDLVAKNDTQQSLREIDSLIAQYGPLSLFSGVRPQLIKRLELQESNSVQQHAKSIHTKLETLQTSQVKSQTQFDEITGALKVIVAEIDLLIQSSVADSVKPELSKCVAQLTELVSEVVLPLKEFATDSLAETIRKEGLWKDIHSVSAKTSKTVVDGLHALLVCQSIDIMYRNAVYPQSLWAFDVLAQDFRNRFVYHFEGKGETNRLDKPEWCLNYFETYLEQHLKLTTFLLSNCLKDTPYESEPFAYLFITSLLVPVRQKLAADLSVVVSHKRNLSHLVFELQQFDQRLKSTYKFRPPFAHHWLGLTGDLVLFNEQVFEVWISNEKDFVSARYDEIVNMSDAFAIDRDAVESNKTKPTKSALNLKTLIESITKTYENLALKHQLKFLSEVQLKLLNFYYEKLQSGRDAFETRILKERQQEGHITPLERVCRIWCSLKFMVEAMETWGEQLVFVQLWSSLNVKKKSQLTQSTGLAAARTAILEMASSISSNLGTLTPPAESSADEILSQTFFDSIIKHYTALLARIQKDLVTLFDREINNSMRDYFAINSWSTTSSLKNSYSTELTKTIVTLSRDLTFVKTTFCSSDYLFVLSHVSSVLAKYIDTNIIRVGRFNPLGGQQLRLDVTSLWEQLGLPQTFDYSRLVQACSVLADPSPERNAAEFKSRLGLDSLETRYVDEILLRKVR
ncbi:unnamed protein product [Kuraishia capsulata CBS 1993]|uniref:RAD50-interacting protein 1 n=1 Tax=Kuraishia capsulata CBS 1993 TaxID=1382522 RepID=W6MWK6_9ASCO|nr:uncharacterized protein KUCA_T00003553001 [Kuraishia capsulata CBS 1993]CDK27575.1 unnamed protein product [Kuraishia capsulata CBS 1993]